MEESSDRKKTNQKQVVAYSKYIILVTAMAVLVAGHFYLKQSAETEPPVVPPGGPTPPTDNPIPPSSTTTKPTETPTGELLPPTEKPPVESKKIDDWLYALTEQIQDSLVLAQPSAQLSSARSAGNSTIGLAVGGAKGIDNFRENIKNDFLPLPTDITHEGLFYDYLFDTGATEACDKLFCPAYTSAIAKDPFSGQDEYFLSVGLNSGIKQADFKRKKLNLVVVLDISGSMSSPFDQYYYDQFGNRQERDTAGNREDVDKNKLRVTTEATAELLNHLNPADNLGVVLFDDDSYLAKPLRLVGDTDLAATREHLLELQPRGGTNMSAGMQTAIDQFSEYLEVDSDQFENRIIFMTDAQPNLGDVSPTGLLGLAQSAAEKKLHTTFIGIGVDFNTELIEKITKIRGSNYYSVHSPGAFKKRLDEGFDFMVTPLVFDLKLMVTAPGFEIKKVYGSPEADQATGQIMKVNTLFPSERTDGETRGGLVLLRMKRIADNKQIKLTTSYRDRNDVADSSSVNIEFVNRPEFYDNSGIRKGIALARYAGLMQNWLLVERKTNEADPPFIPPPDSYYRDGLPVIDYDFTLGRWERQSEKLRVSSEYKKLLAEFATYFEAETEAIGDQSMDRELAVIKLLADY